MTQPLITSKTDWTPELIHEVWGHIADIADNDMRVDYYRPQIEVISAEQMIDCYTSVGLPINYNHWSFGKAFIHDMQQYQSGRMGLAYEIVINSDPCIAYLMEENNMVTQALVMAHAGIGHNAVFKGNYMFKDWTSADSIIDYMMFAKKYIRECEERFGPDVVERVIDAAHALATHGVDKHKRKDNHVKSEEQRMKEVLEKFQDEQKHLDLVMKKTKIEYEDEATKEPDENLVGGEENLLYFLYTHAPNLEPWKREILRIVYKIHQYFYPQSQTKVLNEGFATFTHYYIMNKLEERGVLSSDAQIDWLQLHAGVLYQPDFSTQFNPYALGFAIFKDIKRICEEPTAEDKEWFPQLIGMDWRDAVQEAAFNYRDESFIQQFLSPNLIRKWKLFSVTIDGKRPDIGVVDDISDDQGYRNIREHLAKQHNRINHVPDISVYSAMMKTDRELTLEYKPYNGRKLYGDYANKVMRHIRDLWGYPVQMVRFDEKSGKEVELLHYIR